MIARLKGILEEIGLDTIIVDVNGVGYLVSCSQKTLAALGAKGSQVSLWIETLMRAESLQLFGFHDKAEQTCFLKLLTVQGVGARMALSLLSSLTPEELIRAIAFQDKTTLTRADGVGPKLATRMITELKDKFDKGFEGIELKPTTGTSIGGLPTHFEDAISALVNLGYRKGDVTEVLVRERQSLPENADLQEWIRLGLSHLAKAVA